MKLKAYVLIIGQMVPHSLRKLSDHPRGMFTRYQQLLQAAFKSAFSWTADIWNMESQALLDSFGYNSDTKTLQILEWSTFSFQ